MIKKCTKCKQEKALDEFYKSVKGKYGLESQCKACRNAKNKTNREQNVRTGVRKPYVNETRQSLYDGAIEVKMYGDNDLWMTLDIEDFERFHDYKFYIIGNGYAVIRPEVKSVKLHKLIVDYSIVDHINRDKLDNRKCNLRSATYSQNNINKSMRSDNTSGFKGVSWSKQCQKWAVYIQINKRSTHLGYFDDILEAARAYDKAALEHFGDFAALNFPSEATA